MCCKVMSRSDSSLSDNFHPASYSLRTSSVFIPISAGEDRQRTFVFAAVTVNAKSVVGELPHKRVKCDETEMKKAGTTGHSCETSSQSGL
jgi:hypothetical protein